MESKSQYPQTNIHTIIRDARGRSYRTAKEFWSGHEVQLSVSYPHYAAVEAGKKFPDIRLALQVGKLLKMDLKLVCHVWARDQMPDAKTQAFFEPIPGVEVKGIPSSIKYDLDNFYIFNETQLPGLTQIEGCWDVLMLIMGFSESTPPTEADIAKAFNVPLEGVRKAVEWLRNENIVVSEDGKLRTRKKFFHLPNTPEFKALRDSNFRRNGELLLSGITPEQLGAKTAYRTTYMRRITEKQAVEVSEHIDALIGHLANLDNHGTDLYALTIGFGVRASLKKQEKRK